MIRLDRRQLLRSSLLAAGGLTIGAAMPRMAAAAAQESLTLYNGQHSKTTAALVEAFTDATGIKVEVRKGSSSQLANQIIEEGDASPADMFYSEESPPVVALAEKGLLAKLDDATLEQIPVQYRAKDGTWIGASARCRVIAYNKDLIKESELPKSVLDFAHELWKGKFAFVPTSGAFQEQIIAIKLMKGRDAALDWLKGLKKYGAQYNGNSAAMKAVENGEIPIALVNNYYWYSLSDELGTKTMKSALYYVGDKDPGALLTVSAAGILKSTKKPELARKFLAFMVSEAGQEAIAGSVAEYPVRPGVKSPYDLEPLEKVDPPAITAADLGDAKDALALEREAGLA